MTYLMESPDEAERLLMKSDETTSREQLILTGLRAGMIAVDAGGGAGFVTRIMSQIVGTSGQAILLDASTDRIEAARNYHRGAPNIEYLQTSLECISLDSDSVDYVFCRFVFEYLSEPKKVFLELKRILKPGGKLVIGDLDHNILSHYPLPEGLEAQLFEATKALERLRLWDPYVGRKLYRLFYDGSMKGTKVHLIPHHLIYGVASQSDVQNWELKLKRLEELQRQGVLKLSFSIEQFRESFMKFFKDPGRFSYSPLILVEGQKPSSNEAF